MQGNEKPSNQPKHMKKYGIHLILSVLAMSGLYAQNSKNSKPPLPLLLPVLDADKSGDLSAAEITASSAALAKLDKDGDGKLTPNEFAPAPPKPPEGVKPPPVTPPPTGVKPPEGVKPPSNVPPPTGVKPPTGTKPPQVPKPPVSPKPPVAPPAPPAPAILIKAIDLDDNKELSADEIEDAPQSLLILDINGDGSISRDELKMPKKKV